MKTSISKLVFWAVIIVGAIRDHITDVSNFDNYAFLAVGMLTVIVAYYIFDKE